MYRWFLCPNTCCAGWDIHVDQETLSKVSNTKNKLAKKLFSNKFVNVSQSEYPAKIKNKSKKKCSFLEKDNLCLVQKKIKQNFYHLHVELFLEGLFNFQNQSLLHVHFYVLK